MTIPLAEESPMTVPPAMVVGIDIAAKSFVAVWMPVGKKPDRPTPFRRRLLGSPPSIPRCTRP
jgi:hypothetical protein